MASKGTVKFFNATKGYGFIEASHGDVFVHANDVRGNPLQEGDEVYFDEDFDQMKQKTRAINVSGGTGDPNAAKGFGGGGGKGFGGGKGGGKGGKGYDSYGGGQQQYGGGGGQYW